MTASRSGTAWTFGYVTMLFFVWGAVTAVNDILIPAVKAIFALSDTESFLTQFAFFMAYGVVSLPAAAIMGRLGAANSIIVALATMIAGCLIMPLATVVREYSIVLVGLFVIASGITLLQVAANPLSASLGRPERSHFRLVLSQAFNSFGTVIAPYLAARTLLQGGLFEDGPVTEAKIAYSLGRIDVAYVFIAAVIAVLAMFLYRVRHEITAAAPPVETGARVSSAFASPWALAGALAIFLYVGAEVAIGSAMVNFLEQPDVFAISAVQAGSFVSLYWLGAMIGRFIGSGLLYKLPAGPLLAVAAVAAALICLTISQISGPAAGVLAISVGLFNSIMFPVIFSLTIERSTAPASATSGLLCMAIVGGALVPLVFAQVADASGSRFLAFLVPMACYLVIALFGWRAAREPARTTSFATSLH
ncbi:MFS transporter [Sphingopyxis sp. H038]|uniref:sugar MFS transporter n=1 Tax=unclassified Sphingopyxis TaxID=2614943 RepID=UPI0007300A3D|nr:MULTISPECIES: sugar MFS transporter [unclassified Sphingopyxis]KTE01460.1 MFS transporter [Sphingopyxis sp. H012]KTE06995.1 MFS transporter [Sphingopyxis sp. H093]KTE12614.1 MFS transporter [Sphingopyxis sp. H053]KTE26719.1 MFS transporter [Sphingopyxis sp. H080]KTE34807.1 MFS transporter [Sphingopyxis sp. H038]